MPNPDLDRVAAIIRTAAAEELLPRYGRLAAGDISEKAPGDFVTVADGAMERRLEAELGELSPSSLVVGEEGAFSDRGLLSRLGEAQSAWIIDPLDGTANFAGGLPMFAVIVAFAVHGKVAAAWIYDPLGDRMALAEIGAGAWMAGKRMRVATAAEPARMRGVLNFRYGDRTIVTRMAARCHRLGPLITLGCAGQEYLALCSGKLHFAQYTRLLPWDHAAGSLLHREAGGHAALFDGGAYTPVVNAGPYLLAPDRESWSEIRAILAGEEES